MSLGKRIAAAILILLLAEVAGFPVVPRLLSVARGWLLTWPIPNEHFAAMVGDLGWPLAVLLIAWLLRRPLTRAAYLLAERMKTDDLKIGGFIEINAVSFNPLDAHVAVQHVEVEPVAADVDATESLLEYAGISEDNAERLLRWIAGRYGATFDPETFLTESRFA